MAIRAFGVGFFMILLGLGIPQSDSYSRVKLAAVPLLVGMDVADPKLTSHSLKEGQFKLVVSKRQKNRNILRGRILSQEPKAGSLGKRHSSIFVVVSDGP